MLLTYTGTPSATVGYSIDNADKSEAVAYAVVGVTEMHVGTVQSLYGVVVDDANAGKVINWYEATAYITSEDIPLDADIKTKTDTLLGTATGANTLTFRLLLDSDGDGVADVPNVGVANVVCRLYADLARTTRIREDQTTGSTGYVYWYNLADGTYYVDPDTPGYEAAPVAVTLPED